MWHEVEVQLYVLKLERGDAMGWVGGMEKRRQDGSVVLGLATGKVTVAVMGNIRIVVQICRDEHQMSSRHWNMGVGSSGMVLAAERAVPGV